ncbi:TPA: hypothetical protein ACRQUI_005168 [Escherichia coli]|uniref:hypothetical protein n=1 Tax=Escherichia coli TaxID=562 RepID=UPI0002C9C54C|nr:hypothetical protein [Escherichia coli]EFM1672336.1 hypothetical protein [Escherichia coli]EFM3790774.1 hypothetical protein [Escherichia coli]EGM7826850.1 hypothetical protein [Escherichia coli]EHH7696718.1 hypothetical protein [Escherichia coli]EHW2592364.1 hypothetical protein [Escherichia coli]
MAKWVVRFDIKKENRALTTSETVEAESEEVAIQIAKSRSKSLHPQHYQQGYEWFPKFVHKVR